MKPHKIPVRTALKSYRHSVPSANNFLNKSVKVTNKMKMKMSQRQLECMMDGNTSESLKSLIKKVMELQSSRKFENLIPKRIEKEATGNGISKGRKFESTRVVKSETPVVNSSKVEDKVKESDLYVPTLKEELNCSSVSEHTVVNWFAIIKKIVTPLKIRVTKMWDNEIQSKFNGVDCLQENVIKSSLFPFRVGFGKSSNVGIMRPIQNWTPSPVGDRRSFSTTFRLMKGNGKGGDCKKKGGLPCLKAVTNGAQPTTGDKKLCEKLCMPCCPPARDPPGCIVAQKKKECQKFKPPRPAYSECKKDKVKPIKPCECIIERLPPCNLNSESKEGKNC